MGSRTGPETVDIEQDFPSEGLGGVQRMLLEAAHQGGFPEFVFGAMPRFGDTIGVKHQAVARSEAGM